MTDKTSKIVEFHKSNPLLSKIIIGSTGVFRKITGKESAAKKQSIIKRREQAELNSFLSSTKSLNKSSTQLLANKITSLDARSNSDLKFKKDAVLSASRMMMSPESGSSTGSKKSSASSKKSSSPKKTSYEANEPIPATRVLTRYLN
jgi:hypothetical protein